jgi:hypothetical protein
VNQPPIGVLIAGLVLCYSAGAADEYVGAKVCGGCHPKEFELQSKSSHALALRRNNGEWPVKSDWAFGAGDQAVTFVTHVDEDTYIEQRKSFYAATKALDVTPGHQEVRADAPGAFYRTFDPEPKILRCFACHSTGPLSLGSSFAVEPAELGVRCEDCHGPGRLHVQAAGQRDLKGAKQLIANPARLSASEVNNLCGTCHREPPRHGEATDFSNSWNVRHQPIYLARSACFRKSLGRLSCFTCHDPHAQLVKNNGEYYNKRCLECHQAPAHTKLNAAPRTNCIGCHMPRVAPGAHLKFTNHWIGTYRNGAVLRP